MRTALGLSWLIALVFMTPTGSTSWAQEGAATPSWIWYADDPAQNAEAGTRYFRKIVRAREPSQMVLDVSVDNRYTLWLDGEELASGSNWQVAEHIEVKLPTGFHVLAIEASNEGQGPAGVLVRGGVLPLGQGAPVHTDETWTSSKVKPENDSWKTFDFVESPDWKPARELGLYGVGPWRTIAFLEAADERFTVPDGFTIEMVAAPNVTGSAIALAFDPDGQPCVSVERGPIVRLIDENGDGRYEARQVITDAVQNNQGFAFLWDSLYAVGTGPEKAGIYKLDDRNGDGAFEELETVRLSDGQMAEHGPHTVRMGPDGVLYFIAGNHAHLKEPIAKDGPYNITYEGELLDHNNDARGHASRIKAPGGEIMRSPDRGRTWERVSSGYRNAYDFDFRRDGEIFTFDSDMEWDQGLPWYRPVRVNHATPGSEFGWRNGSGKWPTYFYDSLPGTLDIGRGSPTGTAFYQGEQFPAKYDDAFLISDWSQGRLIAVALERAGASYQAQAWPLVTGQPLNITDVEVGPEGSVYFTTGGRGTQGGLFKVTWTKATAPQAQNNPLDEALTIASPLASFSQRRLAEIKEQLGDGWNGSLREIILDPQDETARRVRALQLLAQLGPEPDAQLLVHLLDDSKPQIRAQAVLLLGKNRSELGQGPLVKALADSDPVVARRACEALVRGRYEIPIQPLIDLIKLGPDDRWLRFAARIAMEHSDSLADNVEGILGSEDPHVSLLGMLALLRATEVDVATRDRMVERQIQWLSEDLPRIQELALLRLIGLTELLGPQEALADSTRERILAHIGGEFPADDSAIRIEQARLLSHGNVGEAVGPILAAQAYLEATREEQIMLAFCLRVITEGWTDEQTRELLNWYETASQWDGGFSFVGYLEAMATPRIESLDASERLAILARGDLMPFSARLIVDRLDLDSDPKVIAALAALYPNLSASTNRIGANSLRDRILDRLAENGSQPARELLRDAFASDLDRRDRIARALAKNATLADLPALVEALGTRDRNTIKGVFNGLRQIQAKPSDPSLALARLILASERFGDETVKNLNLLAKRWTGLSELPPADHREAVAFWRSAYQRLYPNAAPIGSDQADGFVREYTLDELATALIGETRYTREASPERGKLVMVQARCLDCHRYGALGGQGLGPDLTTLGSRFGPREILESVTHPSKEISDQYQSQTIATVDGRILTGMPVTTDGDELVLLLSDGSRESILKSEIEDQIGSDISVMPEGLFNTLTLQQIADLLSTFANGPKVEEGATGTIGEVSEASTR